MRKPESKRRQRQYPPLYEKAIPIILGVIVVGIVILIVIIFAVAAGGS